MTATVVRTDAEPTPFAEMLAGLIEANLRHDPDRAALLRSATIQLEALDAGVVATVRLRPGTVEVAGGPANPSYQVRIRAAGADLLALSAAPLVLGLPSVLHRDGRAVLAAVLRRRVHIRGMFRHPVTLSRFARLLSVA